MSIDILPSLDGPEQRAGGDPIVIDGISYIPSSALLTGIPKITFKGNHSFGVVDSQGEAPRLYASAELGFFHKDTRYLQTWETTFNGQRPISLAHELMFQGNAIVCSMTNPDMPMIGQPGRIPRDSLLIRRLFCLVRDTLHEIIEIRNFENRPHLLQLESWAGGRFDDLFEVRGFPRPRRGHLLTPQEHFTDGVATTALRYEGLDRRTRSTFIHRFFAVEKIRMSPSLVGHFTAVALPPRATTYLHTVVSFDHPSDGRLLGHEFRDLTFPDVLRLLAGERDRHPYFALSIGTDNGIVNRSIQNAQTDIFMLLTREKSGLLYPYAGVPWYSAPFGRDGILTAYQLLPWYPQVARGVLDYVFQLLGSREDPFTDEQPGKVFHEMRRGEMAATREVPFIPYYGSVDATPLALILLYEYVRWTLDLDKLREWWPEALRAMSWIEKWGDSDGDGFLEYARGSATGLVNQGWKDSHDSIMHADGTLARAPIRLCEVQGYAFRARLAMAGLARLQGKSDLAARFRIEALQLRIRFREKFWDPEGRYVYLALDGEGRPCQVKSSNMGHCLWSEILDKEQARSVAGHLMADPMFSGYGIRTLSEEEVSYNPMSYHNGSVWPHDCSIILEGFRYYGYIRELERLSLAQIGVLESSPDFRLPELFCGFRKRGPGPPVPYEVACKPQAWAAGSIFLMIRAMLGISMDVDQNHVVFNNPILTPKIQSLEILGLKGRDWEMDLQFRRGQSGTLVEVTRRVGKVRVLTVK